VPDIERIVQNTRKFKAKYPTLRAFVKAYKEDLDALANKTELHTTQLGINSLISSMSKTRMDTDKIADISTAKQYEEAFGKIYAEQEGNFTKHEGNLIKINAIDTFINAVQERFNIEALRPYNALKEAGYGILFPNPVEVQQAIDELTVEQYEQLAKKVDANIQESIAKAVRLTSLAEDYRTSLEAMMSDLTQGIIDAKGLSEQLKGRFKTFFSDLQSQLIHKEPDSTVKQANKAVEGLMQMLQPCNDELNLEDISPIGGAAEAICIQLAKKREFLELLARFNKTYQESLEKILLQLGEQTVAASLTDDSSTQDASRPLTRKKSIRFYNTISKGDFLNKTTFVTRDFFKEQLKTIHRLNIKSADILNLAKDFDNIDIANHSTLSMQKALITEIKARLHSFESLEELIKSWLKILEQIENDDKFCTDWVGLLEKINRANIIQPRAMSEMSVLIERKLGLITALYARIEETERALSANTIRTSGSKFQLFSSNPATQSPRAASCSEQLIFLPPRSAILSSTSISRQIISENLERDLLRLFKDYLIKLNSRSTSFFANWYDQCQMIEKKRHVEGFISQLEESTPTLTTVKDRLIALKDDNHRLRYNQISLRRYYNQARNGLKTGFFTKETVTMQETAIVDGTLGKKILQAWELVIQEESKLKKSQMGKQYE